MKNDADEFRVTLEGKGVAMASVTLDESVGSKKPRVQTSGSLAGAPCSLRPQPEWPRLGIIWCQTRRTGVLLPDGREFVSWEHPQFSKTYTVDNRNSRC